MKDLIQKLTIYAALFLPTIATAGTFEHWHIGLEKEYKTLLIVNTDSHPQTIWLTSPIKDAETIIEESIQIEAFETYELPLNTYQEQPWIHIKSPNLNSRNKSSTQPIYLQISTQYGDSFSVNPGSSSRWKIRNTQRSDLVLLNLAPFSQTIKIQTQDIVPQVDKVMLGAFERKRIAMKDLKHVGNSSSMLVIEGEAQISGSLVAVNEKVMGGSKSFIADTNPVNTRPIVSNKSRYYLLQDSMKSSSYVVEIQDPLMIAEANSQIQTPNSLHSRILIAQVDYSSNQINRNFLAADKSIWSWHVSKAIRFTQVASQECDGNPEMLEEYLKLWKESQMPICFWNYRISRELTPNEIANP